MFVRLSVGLSVRSAGQDKGKVGQGSTRRQGTGDKEYAVSKEKMIRGLQLYKGSWDYAVGFFALGEKKKRKGKEIDGKIDGKTKEKGERLPNKVPR